MPKRIPKQLYPKGIQRDYASDLLKVAKRTRIDIRPLMAALPALLKEARAEIIRTDGSLREDASVFRKIRKLMAKAFANAKRGVKMIANPLTRRVAARVSKHQRRQFERQVQAALGIDLFPDGSLLLSAIEGFVAENVALIADLPVKTLTEIEGIVIRGATSGSLHDDVAKEIQGRLAISERRAKRIARDQVGKFYGYVNMKRQRVVGLEAFFWTDMGDERVRPVHSHMGGTRYLWSNPPAEGIPGEPVNCRCWAEPDFSTLL